MNGVIKRIVKEKGFGFIGIAGQKEDVFFHFSALKDSHIDDLEVGQPVTFELGNSAKGPRAEDVYVG